MSSISLVILKPSIEIIVDDGAVSIQSSVNADTVLGVTPGSVGLLVLAATTGEGVLTTIGGATPTTAASLAHQAVAAHAMQRNPHREYVTQEQFNTVAMANDSAVWAHAASRSAHPDRPTFDQSILQSQFFGG